MARRQFLSPPPWASRRLGKDGSVHRAIARFQNPILYIGRHRTSPFANRESTWPKSTEARVRVPERLGQSPRSPYEAVVVTKTTNLEAHYRRTIHLANREKRVPLFSTQGNGALQAA